MTQLFITVAAIFGSLSVAAGAFATHALKATLIDRAIEIFKDGGEILDVSCDRATNCGV